MVVIPHYPLRRVETSANIASQSLNDYSQIYYCTGYGVVYGVIPVASRCNTTPLEVVPPVKSPPKKTPICPQHNLPPKKRTVPAGNKDADKTF